MIYRCLRSPAAKLLSALRHPILFESQGDRCCIFHTDAEVCEHFPRAANGQGEIVDKRMKSMMKELGDAINNSLSDSEQIAEVISRIKAGGYDVFVVLEATIGFNQHEEGEAFIPERSPAEFKVTAQDLKFLKSLRIRVEDE